MQPYEVCFLQDEGRTAESIQVRGYSLHTLLVHWEQCCPLNASGTLEIHTYTCQSFDMPELGSIKLHQCHVQLPRYSENTYARQRWIRTTTTITAKTNIGRRIECHSKRHASQLLDDAHLRQHDTYHRIVDHRVREYAAECHVQDIFASLVVRKQKFRRRDVVANVEVGLPAS